MFKLNKKLVILTLVIIFLSLIQVYIVSAGWYYGTLHVHTGYSTAAGYDRNPDTDGDDCITEATTWWDPGYTVAELKEEARNLGLSWQSFTDHSYCLDTTEFNRVASDCNTIDSDPNYVCLSGEELSVDDNHAGWWDETLCGGGGQTAHLGGHGTTSYLEGGVCFSQPYDQQTGINAINNQNGVSIINHPTGGCVCSDWRDVSCGVGTCTDIIKKKINL